MARLVQQNSIKNLAAERVHEHENRLAARTKEGSPRSPSEVLSDSLEQAWVQEAIIRVRHFLEDPRSSPGSTAYHNVVAVTIAMSACIVLFETVPDQDPDGSANEYPLSDLDALFDEDVYFTLDVIIGILILLELLVRFAVAKTYWVPDPHPSDPNHHADYRMQPFFKDVTVLVDVISIVPTFVYFHYGNRTKVIRDSRLNALKSVRVVRVMRLFRNSPSASIVMYTIRSTWGELLIPVLFFITIALLFGTAIWFSEPCYHATECVFQDVHSAVYYAVVTMTTVGYGDLVPTRAASRAFAIMIMLFGSVFLAMPLATIQEFFERRWKDKKFSLENRDKAIDLVHECIVRKQNEKTLSDRLSLEAMLPSPGFKGSTARESFTQRKLRASTKRVFSAFDIGVDKKEKLARVQQFFKRGKLKQSKASRTRVQMMEHYLEVTNGLIDAAASMSPADISKPNDFTLMADRLRTLEHNLYRVMWKVIDVTTQHSMPELVILTEDIANQSKIFTEKVTIKISTNHLKVQEALDANSKRMDIEGALAQEEREPFEVVELQGEEIDRGGRQPSEKPKIRRFSSMYAFKRSSFRDTASHLMRKASSFSSSDLSTVPIAERIMEWVKDRTYVDMPLELCRAQQSDKFRDKLWIFLNFPESMNHAWIRWFMTVVVIISVFVFSCQTDLELLNYGERSFACELVVHNYCSDKDNPAKDPACFVHNSTAARLRFYCDDEDCFGQGLNFGSPTSGAWSCEDTMHLKPPHRAFQTQDSLPAHLYWSFMQYDLNTFYDVCYRPQCDPAAAPIVDLSTFFIAMDCILAFIFSTELAATIYASRKRQALVFDLLVVIDVCALLPWYITIGWMMRHHLAPFGSTHAISAGFAADASIGAHFTTWFLLLHMFKVLRVFKVGRHLPGWTIIVETVQVCWRTLVIPFSFMAFFSLVVGCLMYMIENDGTCVIGKNCEQAYPFPNGSHVRLQAVTDEISTIPTSMQGVWLVLVTLTAVGYGVIFPVTTWGRLIMTLSMVLGVIYMTMPLSIVSASFMSITKAHKQADRAIQQLVIHQSEEHEKRCRLFSHIVLTEHHKKIFEEFKTTALDLCQMLYDLRPLLGRARRLRTLSAQVSSLQQNGNGFANASPPHASGFREPKGIRPGRALRPPAKPKPMSPSPVRHGIKSPQRSMSGDVVWSTEKPLQSQSTKWNSSALLMATGDSRNFGRESEEAPPDSGSEPDLVELSRAMSSRFEEMQQKIREVQNAHMQLGKTVVAICHRLKDIEQSQNPRCAIARRKLMDGTPATEKPIKNSLWPRRRRGQGNKVAT